MEKILIQGEEVIEIYESFDSSFWYITERAYKQDSVINDRVYNDDQILFGFVRLSQCPECAEWGYISETELKLQQPYIWKVRRHDWPGCPDVDVVDDVCEGEKGRDEKFRSFTEVDALDEEGDKNGA